MDKQKFISSDEEQSITSSNGEESSKAQENVDFRAHSRSRIEGDKNQTKEHHCSQEIPSVDPRHENKLLIPAAHITKKDRLISSWKKDQDQSAKITETHRTKGREINSDYANFEFVSLLDENQKTLQLVSCPSNEDSESKEESNDLYEANSSFYVSDDELANPGPSYFTCDVCNQKFETECLLKKHKEAHNVDNSYSNRILDKVCSKRKNLNDKLYQCDKCPQKFTQQSSLISHNRIHTGDKPYQCDKCHKKFTQKSNLNSHYRIHTGLNPFKCRRCGKSFSDASNFRRHQKKCESLNEKEPKE